MSDAFEGSPRYFAWLYSDERMQRVLAALFGIEAEVNAALKPDLEHRVAHARMSWWGEEAERLRAREPVHPLTRALLAEHPAAAPVPDIRGLVDIAAWDLAAATFETGAQLAGYCDRWARALPQLAAGWAQPQAPQAAMDFGHRIGVSLCELEMLVSLAPAARRGRLRMPLDELAALGIAPEALPHPPWPPALATRLGARHEQLRAALRRECAALGARDRGALRGLLVWVELMLRHSRHAQRALPGAWRRTRLSGLGDALGAWRAARRAVRT